MERRYEVRTYGVRYICDACGRGEMVALQGAQAYVQEGGRILIRHACVACHQMAVFGEKYPTVRYEDVPGQIGNAVPEYGHVQQQQFQQQPQQPTIQNTPSPGTNLATKSP